jgi:hypothetical protein
VVHLTVKATTVAGYGDADIAEMRSGKVVWDGYQLSRRPTFNAWLSVPEPMSPS